MCNVHFYKLYCVYQDNINGKQVYFQAPNLGTSAVEFCARKCSATSRRWIFPVAVFGRESVMNTFLGTLKAARFFLQNPNTSASSIFDPSRGITAQFICEIWRVLDNILSRKCNVLQLGSFCYLFTIIVIRNSESNSLSNLRIHFNWRYLFPWKNWNRSWGGPKSLSRRLDMLNMNSWFSFNVRDHDFKFQLLPKKYILGFQVVISYLLKMLNLSISLYFELKKRTHHFKFFTF